MNWVFMSGHRDRLGSQVGIKNDFITFLFHVQDRS